MNRKRLKHFLKLKLLLFYSLTLLWQCQKEENSIPIEQTKEQFVAPSIDNAISFYNQNIIGLSSSTSRTTSTSVTDWDSSTSKKYKQTPEVDVDILYTPIYINTQNKVKAFIASTEQDGIIYSKTIIVFYKTYEIENGLSAYVLIYNLNGNLDYAYNYDNGLQIPFPDANTSGTTSRATDCSTGITGSMSTAQVIDYLSNCTIVLDEVVINAPSGNPNPDTETPNPLDDPYNYNNISIPFIIEDDPQNSGSGTENPTVFVPNLVTASALSISIALDIEQFEIEFAWLLELQQNNPTILDIIAEFLNNNKVRPPQTTFEGTSPSQFPTISDEATEFVIEMIGFLGGSSGTSSAPIDQQDIVETIECFNPNMENFDTCFENLQNDDCNELKTKISDEPLIKTRLNELRLSTSNFEKGFRANKHQGTGQYLAGNIQQDGTNGGNKVNIRPSFQTVVIAHTHPDTDNVGFKMFSAPDILKLAEMANYVLSNGNSTVQLTELTLIVVFKEGNQYKTFALRFDNEQTVQNLRNILGNSIDRKEFNDDLKDYYGSDTDGPPLYNSTTTIAKQQRHIFNLLDKYNLNISLYEANLDGNGFVNDWQKINKDNLEKQPCN